MLLSNFAINKLCLTCMKTHMYYNNIVLHVNQNVDFTQPLTGNTDGVL